MGEHPRQAQADIAFSFSALYEGQEWYFDCISVSRRQLMLTHATFPGMRLYAVEVSGWDSSQSFFVEKCELLWTEGIGKRVVLRQKLRESTILFVRLLQTSENDRGHPVVYEAELVGSTDNGLRQFRLTAAIPRLKEAEV